MSLVVVRAVGLVTIQDLGRPGHMHEGLAPGGALVPELLVAANRRAQNPDDAAAVEVMGTLAVRVEGSAIVATDTRPARELRTGDTLIVASDRHSAAYLAIHGGVDAPLVLGSRSTQLSAGIGHVLRAGDRLRAGEASVAIRALDRFDTAVSIRVMPGPDVEAFAADAFATLMSAPYLVLPSSDRVGGPHLARTDHADETRPMVRGAIEVPRDGQPIVLGPEHPTTGGYPVIAVVVRADVGPFLAAGIGRQVRFVAA